MATRARRRDAGLPKPQLQAPEHPHVLRDFAGINTQAKRQAIGPNEFSWLENLQPIGHGNLRTTAHISGVLATGWSGIVYNMKSFNLDGVNSMFMVTTTGHAYQMDLDGYGVALITDQFSTSGVDFDQWNGERILFIDPVNGYFSWDGALLTRTGTLWDITITDGGAYTSVPTISFIGGGGAGATAEAIMGINGGQEIVSGGTGYTPGDILTMVGGTFDSPGKLKVITAPGGVVDAVAVFDPGSYTVLPSTPVAVTGGTGADDFTFNPLYAVFSVIVTDGGTIPYNEPPQVVFSGSGFTGLEGAQAANAAGTGYIPGEILSMVGGTFTTQAKLQVAVTVSGGVNQVTINERGVYSIQPGNPVASTGGGADDATFNLNWSSDLAAQGTAVLIGGPPTGQHIATFSGRVWISNDRTIYYSAPGTWWDFSGPGSGSLTITDSTLHSDISALIAANNFLYIIGIDSVNVIGDVTTDSTGETIFSNTNLNASIGTLRSAAIIPYYRSLLFLNLSGIYAIYGSTPIKISDSLDGIFERIIPTAVNSAGAVMLNSILCAAFSIGYNQEDDTPGGTDRTVQAIFFNKKWFLTHQPVDLIFMAGGIHEGVQSLYATDGTNFYKLFDDPDTPVVWRAETALWDMDDVTRGKQVTAFGLEFDARSFGTISVSIDTRSNQLPYKNEGVYTVDSSSPIVWVNDLEEEITWVSNSDEIITFVATGYVLSMQDGSLDDGEAPEGKEMISEEGKYVGMTASSEDVICTISSMMLRYLYRESW